MNVKSFVLLYLLENNKQTICHSLFNPLPANVENMVSSE